MSKLIVIDGWKRWVSEVDGGLIRDGLAIVTENTPLPTNYPEHLSQDQIDQTGRCA